MKCAEQKRSGGFTRVDLLSCVAVLGLVMLAAWPAVGSTHVSAEIAVCQNNHRQLARAFLMYATENRELLAPNLDSSGPAGAVWVMGQMGGADAVNTNYLVDPRFSLFSPYLGANHRVFRCPSDSSAYQGQPRVRSVSMNGAVGTNPTVGPERPVYGTWLTGVAGHSANQVFRCFAKVSDMVKPKPSELFTIIDEQPASINDAAFGAMGYPALSEPRWIDVPGANHESSANLSYGDGHVELRRWKSRPTTWFVSFPPGEQEDFLWLSRRVSALVTEQP